jgi:hypothetical protein
MYYSPIWSDLPIEKMYMRLPTNILTGELIESTYLSQPIASRKGYSPFTDYKNELEKTLRNLKRSFSK